MSAIAAGALSAGVVLAGATAVRRLWRSAHMVRSGTPPAPPTGEPPPVAHPSRRGLERRLEPWVAAQVDSAELRLDPVMLIRRGVVVVGLAAVVAAACWGLGGAVVVLVALTAGPALWLAWRRGRAVQRFAAGLPALLESVAGKLRAGASLSAAVASSADDGTGSGLLDADLRVLAQRVAHGQPFRDAVESWAERRSVADVGLVAAALVLGAEVGGTRARALDGVATTLRDRRALAAEVDALSSQARASAVVLMGAPILFAALGLLSDPDVSAFLLRTPAGLGCLLGGLALDAAAGVWMVRIAGSAR